MKIGLILGIALLLLTSISYAREREFEPFIMPIDDPCCGVPGTLPVIEEQNTPVTYGSSTQRQIRIYEFEVLKEGNTITVINHGEDSYEAELFVITTEHQYMQDIKPLKDGEKLTFGFNDEIMQYSINYWA